MMCKYNYTFSDEEKEAQEAETEDLKNIHESSERNKSQQQGKQNGNSSEN